MRPHCCDPLPAGYQEPELPSGGALSEGFVSSAAAADVGPTNYPSEIYDGAAATTSGQGASSIGDKFANVNRTGFAGGCLV